MCLERKNKPFNNQSRAKLTCFIFIYLYPNFRYSIKLLITTGRDSGNGSCVHKLLDDKKVKYFDETISPRKFEWSGKCLSLRIDLLL